MQSSHPHSKAEALANQPSGTVDYLSDDKLTILYNVQDGQQTNVPLAEIYGSHKGRLVRLSEKSLRKPLKSVIKWYNRSIRTGYDYEETMMKYIEKESRKQLTLLPDCIEDYIGEENPVRVIDAFVDSLDMQSLGFLRPTPGETGRPPYDPRDLLKLYIYGYFNRIRTETV